MKQKYAYVVIHSFDQAFYGGTYDPREKEFTVGRQIMLGHLLSANDEKVVIASELFDDYDVRYVSVIPRINVIKMEILREPEKD